MTTGMIARATLIAACVAQAAAAQSPLRLTLGDAARSAIARSATAEIARLRIDEAPVDEELVADRRRQPGGALNVGKVHGVSLQRRPRPSTGRAVRQ